MQVAGGSQHHHNLLCATVKLHRNPNQPHTPASPLSLQAARKKAEELLQQAIAAEMDAKNRLEDMVKKRAQDQRAIDDERGTVQRERMALESMRQEFENELQVRGWVEA